VRHVASYNKQNPLILINTINKNFPIENVAYVVENVAYVVGPARADPSAAP
jgi:hypothetical protein